MCIRDSDIDGLAGEEQELADLVESLDNTLTSYGMEISAEKTKLMTNNRNGIATDIRARDEKLGTVNKFTYLGAVLSDEGSKPEIMSRIVQTSAALKRLKTIWNDKNITRRKSDWSSPYSWTLTADLEKRIQAAEMRCFRIE